MGGVYYWYFWPWVSVFQLVVQKVVLVVQKVVLVVQKVVLVVRKAMVTEEAVETVEAVVAFLLRAALHQERNRRKQPSSKWHRD